MMTCEDTWLFVGFGLMLSVAAALIIASEGIDLATATEEKRTEKASLKLAGHVILLLAGLVFVWKGRCIKKMRYNPIQ
jgi:hypothetical protein